MNKLFILLTASLLLLGCNEKEKVEPEERVTVHIEKRSDGLAYEQYQDKPFTGMFEGYYRKGYKKAEIRFKNGKQHGLAKKWYENGQQSNEANFHEGKLEGVATEWSMDGKQNKYRVFKNGKLIASTD